MSERTQNVSDEELYKVANDQQHSDEVTQTQVDELNADTSREPVELVEHVEPVTKKRTRKVVKKSEAKAPVVTEQRKFKSALDELQTLMSEVNAREADKVKTSLLDAITRRYEYEVSSSCQKKNVTRDEFNAMKFKDQKEVCNIIDALRKVRAIVSDSDNFAKFVKVVGVKPDFINLNDERSSQRYNIYAVEKLTAFFKSLCDNERIENKVNASVIRTMFNFERHNNTSKQSARVPFRLEYAQLAALRGVLADVMLKEDTYSNVRHLFATHYANVGINVMSTQASSTMRALRTLGVVVKKGELAEVSNEHVPVSVKNVRNVEYQIIKDALMTRVLREFVRKHDKAHVREKIAA